jgi:3-oxoacyl-(acyl-carrier-protein) synthase
LGRVGVPPAADGVPPDASNVGCGFVYGNANGTVTSRTGNVPRLVDVPGETPATAGGTPTLPNAHLQQKRTWVEGAAMTPVLAGMGWVTPLGSDLDEVWRRLMAGHVAEVKPLANPESNRVHAHIPVPPKLVEHLGRQPRLRRASPISYYAVGASLAALAHAGLTPAAANERRLAIIFAVSSGSVLYTRKFYEQIYKTGANTASPLLFPETVYNAPASHLAAQLGLNGITYTLVGDSSIGLAALKLAEQLLAMDAADLCLVAGAEELDWVLCEGYRDWRFATDQSTTTLYGRPARGAILAEAGAAVLLGTSGPGPRLAAIHDGAAFAGRREARTALRSITAELAARFRPDCVIGSANGSAFDDIEADALTEHAPDAPLTCPKAALGEALGASALIQVIVAAQALQTQQLPGVQNAGPAAPLRLAREPLNDAGLDSALVLTTGLNQQASGAIVSAPPL